MTDFRALCAELVELEDFEPGDYDNWLEKRRAAIKRAKAALTQPEPDCEQYYEWELQDANDEWVAGGSANDLGVVQAEGRRYLWQYAEDGMHKLIICRHKTTTLMETESGNTQNQGVSQ